MTAKELKCYHCQHPWTFTPPLSRDARCPQCDSDARVCLNCTFYDTHAYQACKEEQAEWVRVKDNGNFCSYFRPNNDSSSAANGTKTVLADLEQLFGTADPTTEHTASKGTKDTEDPKEALLRLFKK